MGIWERIGTVIKSYLGDDDVLTRSTPGRQASFGQGDPDLNAAYEELDDFLRGGSGAGEKYKNGKSEREGMGSAGEKTKPFPEELRKDFAELGLSPDARADECKAAYKKLLKLHHPDRHAGHPGNMKKATEKTAKVNAAYERIVKWFQTQ